MSPSTPCPEPEQPEQPAQDTPAAPAGDDVVGTWEVRKSMPWWALAQELNYNLAVYHLHVGIEDLESIKDCSDAMVELSVGEITFAADGAVVASESADRASAQAAVKQVQDIIYAKAVANIEEENGKSLARVLAGKNMTEEEFQADFEETLNEFLTGDPVDYIVGTGESRTAEGHYVVEDGKLYIGNADEGIELGGDKLIYAVDAEQEVTTYLIRK